MGTLYVVGTPIGNLEDITLRALRVLREADVIFAEDTRVTKKLLAHYKIKTPLSPVHTRNERHAAQAIVAELTTGKRVALVSDAGTPGISDPGALLVSVVREALPDIKIEAVPGPSALTAALSVAGVPASEFLFLGFLPHKKGRETLFKEIEESKRTVVFYESPHRILKTFKALANYDTIYRTITTARELTKIHEEVKSGSVLELLEYFTKNSEKVRGEFVVIVSP